MVDRSSTIAERSRARMEYRFILSFFFLIMLIPHTTDANDASQVLGTALRNYLKENYPWAETEIHELLVNQDFPEELPERIMVKKGPPGRTIFVLQYKNGRRITATALVRAFDWVVMTRRAYKKGYSLQQEDLFVTLMDVSHLPRGAIQETDQAIGKSLTRPTLPHMPLVDSMIRESASVKKGKRVTLVAESPGFTITVHGELKENSEVGSPVKAMNLNSRETVVGILIDESTIKVDF
jgi:flagella basal body P-ring formation protein FlgA